MKKIEAKIIADSINSQGNRLTTYILTYPRFIHAEVMTHRLFSRNTASSRAIPFKKMLKMVQENPFIPIAWQKDHSGMQGVEYFERQEDIDNCYMAWMDSCEDAVESAVRLSEKGITKQLCNRLLEPFLWHTALVTASEWDNFFELRCPKYQTPVSQLVEPQRSWKDLLSVHSNPINEDLLTENQDNWVFKMQHSLSGAEIHIQALAEAMWDAYNESKPKQLQGGEWHIPFSDNMDITINSPIVSQEAAKIIEANTSDFSTTIPTIDYQRLINTIKLKVAVARCARLSYMTFDNEINYQKDIELHDMLLKSKHASPYEHVSRCLTEKEYNTLGKMILNPVKGYIFEKGWVDNFKGFISYRRILNF